MYGVFQSSFEVLTVVLSALTGTSYISLRWLSRRLCWEWAWMIWLKVFLLSCLGGRAGGRPSSTSGDLREEEKEKCMFTLWLFLLTDSQSVPPNSFLANGLLGDLQTVT
ncbi:hypothetical protein EYF80_017699 [Liparis tanakae]|uniref:Uncharacterized protein n=1 Tax=Liparis tanakae TaxID=230148 RepID=A0A4Z2I4D5_9TELE|nr:hypothetical protein EYF80_017699 [Liparis tanakae]